MSTLLYILLMLLSGLFVGALGRLALPGRDPMTVFQTILIGVAGSLAAGLLAWAVSGERGGGGIILSVAFATLFVWLVRRSRERGSPGAHA